MAIALMTGAMGCSVNVLEVGQDESLKIVFEAAPFVDGDCDADTRTSVVPNEAYTNYEFIWSAKDTVGIYPDAGSQIFFTMENGAGASSTTFDGGAWTCKEGHTFRSYYPFIGNIYLDATRIPVSFTGQKQVGNGNSDHFQKYDYMYTAATTKDSGFLNFSYNHLGTVVLPWVELPAGHYTGLTLSLDEALFVTEGEYDLTAVSPAIVGKKYSDSMSIDLDVTFTSPDILKVYVTLAPMDMSGKTLTITVTDENGQEFTYTYNPSKPYLASKIYRLRSATSFAEDIIPDAIDLGLPSGLKWASFNLGASAPEEYGDYYAWGETEPYYSSQDPLTWKDGKKDGYSWLSYKWCKGSYKIVTKYCSDSSYGYNGFTDTKTVLDSEDDAASVNLGGNWRMPTYDEFTELKTNCTWEWTQVNGINGRKVTGPNGNSIFLPAAGDLFMLDFKYAGSVGTYWSSSLDAGIPYNAVDFGFNSDLVSWNNNQRYIGYSVRPVTE